TPQIDSTNSSFESCTTIQLCYRLIARKIVKKEKMINQKHVLRSTVPTEAEHASNRERFAPKSNSKTNVLQQHRNKQSHTDRQTDRNTLRSFVFSVFFLGSRAKRPQRLSTSMHCRISESISTNNASSCNSSSTAFNRLERNCCLIQFAK